MNDDNQKIIPLTSAVLYIALANVVLHFLSQTFNVYGIFRDEYYYLACADHLAFGYVDQPPLSILILAINKFFLGKSLLALRFLPSVMAGVIVYLTGLIAREMQADRFGQILCALVMSFFTGTIAFSSFYSMNVFDLFFWTLLYYLLLKIINTNDSKYWIWFGIAAGLGLENKISVLVFGLALVLGLLLTKERRWYTDKHFWIGGIIAVIIFAPYIIWQIPNGWPTLEFIANAKSYKISDITTLSFLGTQLILINTFLVPFAIGGLIYLLFGRKMSTYRLLGYIFVLTVIILLFQKSKPYYLLAAYAPILVAGAIGWGRFIKQINFNWLKPVSGAYVIIMGLLVAPMATPLLPVDTYIKYARFFGIHPKSGENNELGALPQHFADRFGWENFAKTISKVYMSLSEKDREVAVVAVSNYGEAGAIDYYRDKYELPPVVCQHNNYWYWVPADVSGEVVIETESNQQDLLKYYESAVPVDTVRCKYCLPSQNNLPVFICRGFKFNVKEIWPRLKNFI